MNRIPLISATCLFMLLAFCSAPPVPEVTLADTLQAEIPGLMEAAEVPGLSIAIVREGEIYWSGAFGVRSAETGELRGFTVAYKNKGEGLVFFSNSENAFALADPLVALITDEPQYGMQWLEFDEQRFDSPKRNAHRSVEKAFLDLGVEAGVRRLAEVQELFPDLIDADAMGWTAGYLMNRGKTAGAGNLCRVLPEGGAGTSNRVPVYPYPA